MRLLPPPPRWSIAAIVASIALPIAAGLLVQALVPSWKCGMFGFDCLFYTVIAASIGWIAGIVAACFGLGRGETPWLAWLGIVFNGLPLLLLAMSIVLIVSR